MKIISAIALPIVLLLLPTSLLAQQAPEAAEQQNESEKPYEVVITGKVTRAYLRGLIEDVEEDFFDQFNELNLDETYDMYCYKYTPTMSHIKKRACEPLFMIKYRSDQSSYALFAISGANAQFLGSALAGVYLESPREMRNNLSRYYETLVEKMEELVRTNQELGEIAKVMEQLKNRLENY